MHLLNLGRSKGRSDYAGLTKSVATSDSQWLAQAENSVNLFTKLEILPPFAKSSGRPAKES
jgi:hypothetical protein